MTQSLCQFGCDALMRQVHLGSRASCEMAALDSVNGQGLLAVVGICIIDALGMDVYHGGVLSNESLFRCPCSMTRRQSAEQ